MRLIIDTQIGNQNSDRYPLVTPQTLYRRRITAKLFGGKQPWTPTDNLRSVRTNAVLGCWGYMDGWDTCLILG